MRVWYGEGFTTEQGRKAHAFEVVAKTPESARRLLNDVAGWVYFDRGSLGPGRVVTAAQEGIRVRWSEGGDWEPGISERKGRQRLPVANPKDIHGLPIDRVLCSFKFERRISDLISVLANKLCDGNRTQLLSRLVLEKAQSEGIQS